MTLSQCTVLWRWRMLSRSFSPLWSINIYLSHFAFPSPLSQRESVRQTFAKFHEGSLRVDFNLNLSQEMIFTQSKYYSQLQAFIPACHVCTGSSACQKSPIKLSHVAEADPMFPWALACIQYVLLLWPYRKWF